tara:strand:+ start:466 stop:651 length:186 start_codon:yes stop_codon:yes gene_type:complete
MNVLEKEILISKMYSMLNEDFYNISKQYNNKETTYEEYQKKCFPIGAIQKISEVIRNFEGE